jgi:site-specific recombinase XerD
MTSRSRPNRIVKVPRHPRIKDLHFAYEQSISISRLRDLAYCFDHVVKYLGDQYPEDVTRQEAAACMARIQKEKDLSAATMEHYLEIFIRFYCWLYANGVVPYHVNPFAELRSPRPEQYPVQLEFV